METATRRRPSEPRLRARAREDGSAGAPVRTFLVGCPRSGTTLLQSLLFAHPRVISFPETHFFPKVVISNRLRRLGLASRQAGEAIEYLIGLGLLEPGEGSPQPLTVGGHARLLTKTLDAAAHRSDSSHWLEKTPNHLRYVGEIERHIPNARIVHIIRSGEAVVASLQEAARKRPDVWWPLGIDQCVEVWRSDVHRSRSCIGRLNHAFVSYERLVAHPPSVLRRLCACLELPVDDAVLDRMLSDYAVKGTQTKGYVRLTESGPIREPEPWKDDLGAPIRNRNAGKFQTTFTPVEQAEIKRAVAREDPIMHSFPFL